MKKVIIVGGGILGTSVAYHLSKLQVEVTLIDRQDKGQATRAAAGIICPWLSQRRNRAWYTLAKNGARYYSTLIAELAEAGQHSTGYKKVGALCVHQDMSKLEQMMARALERKEDAPEIGELTMLDNKQARLKFPLLAEGYSALHVSGAARVDGYALTKAMRQVAIDRGIRYIIGEAELIKQQDTFVGVMVGSETLLADEIIVCAGAWSNHLLYPHQIDIDVSYQKAQILHVTANDEADTAQWPVIMPPNDQYILAFENQKLVLGATHENDVEGYDLRPTVAGINDIMTKGLSVAEGISNCEYQEVKIGFRPYTANFLPVFGNVSKHPELWVANGLGSSGLTVGPYVGLQLAQMMQNGDSELNREHYELSLAAKKN